MRRYLSAAMIAVAVGTLAAPITARPALSADKSPADKTIRLHVVGDSDFDLPVGYIASSQDYSPNGKHLGSDVTTCRAADDSGQVARCDVGLALEGGLLVLTFERSAGARGFTGRVVSGTGNYKGAHGRLYGSENNDGTADVRIVLR